MKIKPLFHVYNNSFTANILIVIFMRIPFSIIDCYNIYCPIKINEVIQVYEKIFSRKSISIITECKILMKFFLVFILNLQKIYNILNINAKKKTIFELIVIFIYFINQILRCIFSHE